ncbi:hypothetical protein GCM10011332_31890 [Terasakiella brassicae]|jgi:hypothetical protein|uniref:Uncharacterized protein n=1 Tax=Terasakiella brassicae TaxID=1634917 RepID=A0A917C798_9PROT|nr:hypothetical protein GCM10011332_31890 [Terasakiella brassicae]
MLIKSDHRPLFEQAFEFLRANCYLNDAADFSRDAMGRSRTYLSMLRYNGHQPSPEVYGNLHTYLQTCLTETTDTELCHWLEHYINKVRKMLS